MGSVFEEQSILPRRGEARRRDRDADPRPPGRGPSPLERYGLQVVDGGPASARSRPVATTPPRELRLRVGSAIRLALGLAVFGAYLAGYGLALRWLALVLIALLGGE